MAPPVFQPNYCQIVKSSPPTSCFDFDPSMNRYNNHFPFIPSSSEPTSFLPESQFTTIVEQLPQWMGQQQQYTAQSKFGPSLDQTRPYETNGHQNSSPPLKPIKSQASIPSTMSRKRAREAKNGSSGTLQKSNIGKRSVGFSFLAIF